jgi:RNA recognition motif-containing protein
MLKVANLPIQTTKSDLDELFLHYGTITKYSIIIEIEKNQSVAYVELDKNENAAREGLDKKVWRGKSLRVDKYRGDGLMPGQPISSGTGSNNSGNKTPYNPVHS